MQFTILEFCIVTCTIIYNVKLKNYEKLKQTI